jgi:predicted metal-binding membrane protein
MVGQKPSPLSRKEQFTQWLMSMGYIMKLIYLKDQKGARPSSHSRPPVIWPWVLIFAAWTVALLAVLTKQTFLLNHNYLLTQNHLPWLVALAVFLVCRQVMIVSMMLPSSMPLVYMIVHASRYQRHPRTTQAAFLAGYACIWTSFALAAFIGDTLVHWLVSNWFWLYMHFWLIAAVTFAIAGGFQLSPLKQHCLKGNRSTLSFFENYFRPGGGSSWHLGLKYGIICLGSCWGLMLIMFGIGVGSIVWMASLTGMMVVEKTYPSGQRISHLLGIILLLMAALWLVHPAWLLAGSGV